LAAGAYGLDAHEFYRRTSVDPGHVRFCRARADKRIHAVDLRLTHFVDDRVEVHAALHGFVEHQYLFGPQPQPAPGYTTAVLTWSEARRLIEPTLDA
jgi:hypothetical protein